jgi:hypothetical protein
VKETHYARIKGGPFKPSFGLSGVVERMKGGPHPLSFGECGEHNTRKADVLSHAVDFQFANEQIGNTAIFLANAGFGQSQ